MRPRRPNPLPLILIYLVVFVLLAAIGAFLFQGQIEPLPPEATSAATAPAAALLSPAPLPTTVPSPIASPTAAAELRSLASSSALTITFGLQASIPQGAQEALLWYDSATGRNYQRFPLNGSTSISRSVELSVASAGLSVTQEFTTALDYVWNVRTRNDQLLRVSGSLLLPPELQDAARVITASVPITPAWQEYTSAHFRFLYAADSDAARDLPQLAEVAEASLLQASQLISSSTPLSVTVYLLPRVFWQGGVAYGRQELAISYLDRNYAGIAPWSYFVHEVTHALADAALPDEAEVGGLLGEGIAVIAAGGHYGLEPVDQWAAAMLRSEYDLPLCELRADFYAAQHEVAYQLGASFSAFLIREYGREAFLQAYAAQQPQRGGLDEPLEVFCARVNAEVPPGFTRSYAELEADWRSYLASLPQDPDADEAIRLKIEIYDLMRRYQERYDPPARRIPPPGDSWTPEDTRDFWIAPQAPRNLLIEVLLASAQRARQNGELERARALYQELATAVDQDAPLAGRFGSDASAILELLQQQARAIRLADSDTLARSMAQDVQSQLPYGIDDLLVDLRYELRALELHAARAEALVRIDARLLDGAATAQLYQMRFERQADGWRLTASTPATPDMSLPPGVIVQ